MLNNFVLCGTGVVTKNRVRRWMYVRARHQFNGPTGHTTNTDKYSKWTRDNVFYNWTYFVLTKWNYISFWLDIILLEIHYCLIFYYIMPPSLHALFTKHRPWVLSMTDSVLNSICHAVLNRYKQNQYFNFIPIHGGGNAYQSFSENRWAAFRSEVLVFVPPE